MVVETKKILDPKIKVTATCVRVPVFVGHSEAINIEFENEISAEQAQAILREAPGIMLVDKREDGGYVTPVECVGEYATYVSRVREDPTVENGLSALVRLRQSPQGRGAERGPDRRAARPAASEEGGVSSRSSRSRRCRSGAARGGAGARPSAATKRPAREMLEQTVGLLTGTPRPDPWGCYLARLGRRERSAPARSRPRPTRPARSRSPI